MTRWDGFTTAQGTVGWSTGSGPRTAVVLHGGPGLSDYTEDLAAEVAAAAAEPGELRLVRYQQRGVAPSRLDGDRTVADQVAELGEVLDHLGVGRALLVGHSWGGHLAMHGACAMPERVEGLVLVDPLGAVGDGGASTLMPTILERIGEAGAEALAALAEAGLDALDVGAAMLAIWWPGYFADPPTAPPMPPMTADLVVNEAISTDASRLLEEGVLERGLPTLDLPSALLVGASSPLDPAVVRLTADVLPGCALVELPCGHFPWLEVPGAVTDATREVLARLP